jgi:hypothetical protein
MFALINDNNVTQVGELTALFPNTSFPAGFNQAEFAAQMGALEVIEGERKDERFYWVTFSHYEVQGDKAVRVYTNTPKALEDVTEEIQDPSAEKPEDRIKYVTTKGLKSNWIAQAKAAAGSALAATDWMVIRKAERGVEIPAEVVAERAKIISDCTAKEVAISAAATVEALIAVVAPVNTEEP